MQEKDSLGDFNVDDFLSQLDKNLRESRKIIVENADTAPPPLVSVDPIRSVDLEYLVDETKEEARQRAFEEAAIKDILLPRIDTPTRELAQFFKDYIRNAKINVAFSPLPPEDKKLWASATLESFSITCENKFIRMQKASGRATDPDRRQSIQQETTMWEKAEMAVRAAAEI